jgi:hypothetical protein
VDIGASGDHKIVDGSLGVAIITLCPEGIGTKKKKRI